MKKIIEVLRLKYAGGLSHAQIGQACAISKGVVSKYVSLAAAHGLTWPLPADLDEARLEGLLFPPVAKPAAFAEPDHFGLHQALKRKGVTLQLLWSEYVAVHGERAYRYSQFCHHYHQWRAAQKRSMRQHHRAGEKLFIDYAGPTVEVIDRATGEVRQAQVFVAVLGASSYTYAEATWSQSLPDWIAAHQRALRFFGGVPQLLVPDNLRAAVTQACRYEPGINATYAEMAAHYGTAVLPARPYKPKDKAKAEVGVQVVERWILARLRHHTFFALAEVNRAIAALLPALNERPFQGAARAARTCSSSSIVPPSSPCRPPSTSTPSGARPSPGSTTMSRSTGASTACPTPWWARCWSCA
jgi:transposase